MSDNVQSIGYLSHSGDYGLRNNRALGGVTQLWSDAFARAMAEQIGDGAQFSLPTADPVDASTGEPIAGVQTLSQIVEQRNCAVTDTQVKPPEPLFLPIAEFETDLLPPAPTPFDASELIAQQRSLDFDTQWVRPTVMHSYDANGQTTPADKPRPLHLPIAEFETDLLPPAPIPFDEATMAAQQRQLDYDNGWARPIVLQNLRLVA